MPYADDPRRDWDEARRLDMLAEGVMADALVSQLKALEQDMVRLVIVAFVGVIADDKEEPKESRLQPHYIAWQNASPPHPQGVSFIQWTKVSRPCHHSFPYSCKYELIRRSMKL